MVLASRAEGGAGAAAQDAAAAASDAARETPEACRSACASAAAAGPRRAACTVACVLAPPGALTSNYSATEQERVFRRLEEPRARRARRTTNASDESWRPKNPVFETGRFANASSDTRLIQKASSNTRLTQNASLDTRLTQNATLYTRYMKDASSEDSNAKLAAASSIPKAKLNTPPPPPASDTQDVKYGFNNSDRAVSSFKSQENYSKEDSVVRSDKNDTEDVFVRFTSDFENAKANDEAKTDYVGLYDDRNYLRGEARARVMELAAQRHEMINRALAIKCRSKDSHREDIFDTFGFSGASLANNTKLHSCKELTNSTCGTSVTSFSVRFGTSDRYVTDGEVRAMCCKTCDNLANPQNTPPPQPPAMRPLYLSGYP